MPVNKFWLGAPFFLSFALTGCGGPPPGSSSSEMPQLTKAVVEERINDARVYDVPPESGTGQAISWSFDEDEPKEITIVDQQMDGTKATLILDIKTRSNERARVIRELEGRIRTEWRLESGLVLRRWEIDRTENISMKYRDLTKPGESNPNASPPANVPQ